MQEGIIQIGKVLMEGSSILDNLISDVPSKVKDKQLHVLKFMFSSLDNSVKLDPYEEMSEESSKKYLFIGSAPGANSKQWYATATNNFYHLSETIANLSEMDFGEELNEKINSIKENNFIDLGDNFKSNKNRYAFNFENLNNSKWSQDSLRALVDIKEEKKTKENLKKEILRAFEEYLNENYSLKLKDIGLYTIFIDGKPLCEFEEYKKAIIKEKEGNKKVKKTKEVGRCYYCQSSENLRDDIIIEVKSYTTNLEGFGSGASKKNYKKNMILCQDCLNAYLSGEKFIKNNLKTTIAKFSVYIYPHFIVGESLCKDFLKSECEKIGSNFNTIVNYEKIENLDKVINEEISYNEQEDNTYYSLNLLFYKQNQKATKIQRLIKDINPMMIKKIAQSEADCEEQFSSYYKGKEQFLKIDLKTMYFLIPIRLDNKSDATQFRSLLSLYDCIFTNKSINRDYIIKNINSCLKVIYYDEKGFNISNPTSDSSKNNLNFINTAIKGNMLIKFLMIMGNIKGGQGMDVTNLKLDEELKQYIKEMGYTEEETALFLLGVLMGNIGTAQYNRNRESARKPILNKINFGGIDKPKLQRLSSEVFGKLQQEKILKNNEIVFQQHKELLDKHFKKWSLNKNENLFYILSGYAHASMKAITGKKNGGEKNEQQ